MVQKTPKSWNGPKDARENSNAGDYPNYWTKKTRSGHVMTFDDSAGAEHITLQHRGGSKIQFRPDGAVTFTSHNGQYNFVFGENRVKITGAYDVTVEGGGSLKVDGDYNVKVGGEMNFAVTGGVNMASGGKFNFLSAEGVDIKGKALTTSVDNLVMYAEKSANYISGGPTVVSATHGDVAVTGGQKAGLYADGGDVVVRSTRQASFSGRNTTISSDQQTLIHSGQTTSLQYGINGIVKSGFVAGIQGDNKEIALEIKTA